MTAPAPAHLLRQRNFSALWWGQLISILGERLTYLALVGLLAEHTAHFREANSSWLLSLLANVMLTPRAAVLRRSSGAWVDRWNLRRVLDAVRTCRGRVLVVLIPLQYAFTHHTLPVFAIVFAAVHVQRAVPAGEERDHARRSSRRRSCWPRTRWLSAPASPRPRSGALGGGWIIDHWGWPVALYLNGGDLPRLGGRRCC